MNSKDVLALARFASDKMQKVNLYETQNFFCDIYCLEPGQEQKPHTHADADKIYFVINGRGTFLIGDEEAELSANQAILAAAGAVHGVRNQSNEKLMLFVLMSPNPNLKK
ncbi:MAG TPA: cupin domain-containing protein [Blastocatellia bacterium]|nr:cupin domain-containing protein [Blastocatellia bacterium]